VRPAPPSPVSFDADGLPRSRRFGDVYFSREGGLAETRAVFLAGCGLPERWTGRRRFVVGELGFGTGLNIVALLELWRANRPPGGQLSIFSVEAEPLGADDARRALAAFPEIAPVAELLLSQWPGQRAGFHRLEFRDLGATLDLAVMDAEAALAAWDGRADAWFLDGFAPAVNPGMWTDALMALVAARSAPGAIAASYTVAGQARRALAAAGFALARQPGFGGKRERLEACLPGALAPERARPRVAIVGAGIAGAALARALAVHGVAALTLDAAGPGAGASGNVAALVTPRLDAGLGAAAQLHAQAFDRAVRIYQAMGAPIVVRGVLQLEAGPRDALRFAKIAASDLFEPGELVLMDAGETSALLGEPSPPGLMLTRALVVEPAQILHVWMPDVLPGAVARLERREGGGWRLLDANGLLCIEADLVFLATGADLARLWSGAPIQPVRGQLTEALGVTTSAAAWGAYVGPTRDGLMFGATHDRDDTDTAPRAEDDQRNLAALSARRPRLAAQLAGSPLAGRASIRATTPDHLPLAGALGDGLFVLGGLGARGFALAPLLAEHVAALALGAPSPLPAPLAAIVAPGRFAAKRQRIASRTKAL